MNDLKKLVDNFLAERDKGFDWNKNSGCEWHLVNSDARLTFSVLCKTSSEMTFMVCVNVDRPILWSASIFYQGNTRVDGLDMNGRHTNPGEQFRYDKHHHRQIYTGDEKADYAVSIPAEITAENILGALNWYLRELHFTEIPDEWFNPPPVAQPSVQANVWDW